MLAPVQDQKHLDSRKLLWLDSNILAMFAQQLTGNRSVNLFDVVDDDNTDTKKRIASVPPFAKKINVLSEMFVHPATHLAYAATWFTLCVAGFAMTYLRFRGKGGRGKISKK